MMLFALVLLSALQCDGVRCTCAADDTDDAGSILMAAEDADVVALVRVTAITRIRLPGDADGSVEDWIEATLTVEKAWKGPTDARIRVRTSAHPTSCGYPFESGTDVLVYATAAEDGRLYTDSCTRSRRRDRAATDIAVLDRMVGT